MTQEVSVPEVAEVQPEVPVSDVTAESPEVAEQENPVVEETLEQKVERLEKEAHGKQKRIDKQAAKLHAERDAARIYRTRLEQIEASQNPNQRQITPEQALQERAHMVEVETKAVVKIEGLAEQDGKFVQNLKALQEEVGPLLDGRNLPSPLLESILDCDKPTKVVAYLVKNPEVAAELEGLNPKQLTKHLTKLEMQLQTAPRTSNNPDPIKPIGQKGKGVAKGPEDMSMEEYVAYRKKEGARWAR
jgi:hypothetical protein